VGLSGGKGTSTSISSLTLGSHTVTATYSGDANFTAAAALNSPISAFTQTVNKPSPTITISSSKNPAIVGDPVIWTATLTAGTNTPTGTVRFKVDGTNFDGAVTLAGGSGSSLALATLATGTHTVAVVYSGDSNCNTATSANFSQTVNTSPVTPATGGTAISADTTGGAYTTLTGPVYTEAAVGAVGTGTLILNAPAGFVFDTGGTNPTVKITGSATSSQNINDAANGAALAMSSVTATQLTFTVTAASASKGIPNKLTWQSVRVRPAAGTPLASGIITRAGTSKITGVATNTSFGFLAETAGAASALVLQTPPSATANAGVPFAQQPVIQIQDQFGNARTYASRNADNSTAVSAALASGAGSLQGTLTLTAANGLATFSNLYCDTTNAQATIAFTSGTLASVVAGPVTITPAPAPSLVTSGAASYQQPSQNGAAATATDAQVAPVIQSLSQQADGSMALRATGAADTTYSVQACEQLGGAWTAIGTSTSDSNGTIVFVDSNAANYNSRFYRLALP
jgi:hypothetical protein